MLRIVIIVSRRNRQPLIAVLTWVPHTILTSPAPPVPKVLPGTSGRMSLLVQGHRHLPHLILFPAGCRLLLEQPLPGTRLLILLPKFNMVWMRTTREEMLLP